MFGKKWQSNLKYYDFHFDGDNPRTLRIWFTLWYSFVALTFSASLYLVLIHAPFNPLGILVCLLAFTAYILNSSHVRLIHPFNNSLFWLLLYILFLFLYMSYIHPYVFFFYNLNIFIILVSLYNRISKVFTPTTPSTDTLSPNN